MSWIYSTHGGKGKFIQDLGKKHLEDLDVVGRLILKWILKKCRMTGHRRFDSTNAQVASCVHTAMVL